MNEVHLRRLAAGTRSNHLVLAGEVIGLTAEGAELAEGDDVVVTGVFREGTGWRISYVRVAHSRSLPAA